MEADVGGFECSEVCKASEVGPKGRSRLVVGEWKQEARERVCFESSDNGAEDSREKQQITKMNAVGGC